MRGELVRAEKLFSEALEDQRKRIAFAEEQLRVNLDAVEHFGESSPLAEIMASLDKPTQEAVPTTVPDEVRNIIEGPGSASSKSRKLAVYILERATKPLKNYEIVNEHDRLGLKTGWTPEEVLLNEPDKSHTQESAERRSFTRKWGLIRHAFDPRVIRLDNDTYWLQNHPRGPASST
jgi:hypothetical protein